MNDRKLVKHYDALTPEERVRLMLAAEARRDSDEITRLWTRCPTIELRGPDPQIGRRLTSIGIATHSVYRQWTEVAHFVILARMVDSLEPDATDASWTRAHGQPQGGDGDTEGEDPRDLEGRRMTGAPREWWSALWKGIEAGVMRFGAEIGLSKGELFATVVDKEMLSMSVIEQARRWLDADVPADDRCAQGIYRGLRHAWCLEAEPNEGTAR